MNNEELHAKQESLHSLDDAYALAKDGGFTGSMEDFLTVCVRAAEETADRSMSLEDMEAVAGVASAGEILSSVGDWCSENKEALIYTGVAIAGAAVVAVGVTYGVKAYRDYKISCQSNPDGDLPFPSEQVLSERYGIKDFIVLNNLSQGHDKSGFSLPIQKNVTSYLNY